MKRLEFYIVDNGYIKYLQTFDKKVVDNSIENKKDNRKFIGIILEVNGLKYIAPLTSPKPKHKVMKN
nr:type III toxin-antitoxin system ToxN/AbiQ family toxin [uncultured Fusobacterium sp.]